MDKIKKCLRLAKGTNNISEAESAMKMAQRLALKEGLNLDEIDNEYSDECIEVDIPQKTKTVPSWRALLAVVIADNFRVKLVKVSLYGGSKMKVIGFKKDIEVFMVMFDYAETCLDVFFKSYLKKEQKFRGRISRSESLKMRNSYVEGFVQGMREGFKENVEKYELSVTVSKEVEDYLAVKRTKGNYSPKSGLKLPEDTLSYLIGVTDGREASNRKGIEEESKC